MNLYTLGFLFSKIKTKTLLGNGHKIDFYKEKKI